MTRGEQERLITHESLQHFKTSFSPSLSLPGMKIGRNSASAGIWKFDRLINVKFLFGIWDKISKKFRRISGECKSILRLTAPERESKQTVYKSYKVYKLERPQRQGVES